MALRTLIVDDSATYRSIVGRSLRTIPEISIVGKAANGKQALFFLERNEVDLITLDVQMPEMDGLQTLEALKKNGSKAAVIVLSGLSENARDLTIKCLGLGALDFVLKPDNENIRENQEALIEKISNIIRNLPVKSTGSAQVVDEAPIRVPLRTVAPRIKSVPRRFLRTPKNPKLFLIGISTGGPKALMEVVSAIKPNLSFPILIVQHMPPKFTKSLAENLNSKCKVTVKEAEGGEEILPGVIYLAPGGMHMEVMKTNKLSVLLNHKPPVNSCRPSVDTLFFSVQDMFEPGELVAFIMTGMGRDGADGCASLIQKGAFVGVQSESSCTVYGMPRMVIEEGNYHKIFELKEIGGFVNSLTE